MEVERKRIRRVVKLAEQAAQDPIYPGRHPGGPGRGKRGGTHQKESGNRALYLLRRVAGKDPDVLQGCLDGKYTSALQAAKDAGVAATQTPLDKVKPIWAKGTEEERVAIREWVGQQVLAQND